MGRRTPPPAGAPVLTVRACRCNPLEQIVLRLDCVFPLIGRQVLQQTLDGRQQLRLDVVEVQVAGLELRAELVDLLQALLHRLLLALLGLHGLLLLLLLALRDLGLLAVARHEQRVRLADLQLVHRLAQVRVPCSASTPGSGVAVSSAICLRCSSSAASAPW
jgi:hypothetical protein